MRRTLSISLLVLPLLLAGCGEQRASDSKTAPPTTAQASPSKTAGGLGPNDLALKVTTVGGIAGLGGKGSLPDVAVYGDGRVVAHDGTWATEYRLTRAAYDRLISDARKAGLATPVTADGDPHISDALYTVITFAADGTPKTTKLIKNGGGGPGSFLSRLDPKKWPAGDLAAPAGPYRPDKVAVLAVESPPAGTTATWPFASPGSGVQVGTRSCTVLTGKDVATAQRLAARNTGTWRDHGRTYLVTFRPLLPDEQDCAALARS